MMFCCLKAGHFQCPKIPLPGVSNNQDNYLIQCVKVRNLLAYYYISLNVFLRNYKFV